MANFLGSKTINLAERKIEENNSDLITIVHVLEHLDKPKNHLVELKASIKKGGIR